MPKRLTGINLDELSLVDSPANKGARVVLYKRDPLAKIDRDPLVEVCRKRMDDDPTDFAEALAGEMREQVEMEISDKIMPLMFALQDSIRGSAQKLSGAERDDKIRANVEDFLGKLRDELDKGDDEEFTAQEQRAAGLFARALKALGMAGPTGNPPSSGKEESHMTPDELQKKLEDLEGQVTQLTKERDTAQAALETAAQEHGLEVSKNEDGTVTVTKAAGNDEEYIDIDGERVAKSAVPGPLLKRLEADRERITKLEAEREREALRKRAETELPNLAGTADERAELLKAMDAVEDEALRKRLGEILHAADSATRAQFIEKGQTATGGEDGSSPEARVEALTKEKREADPSLTEAQARAEVWKSAEGRELRKQLRAAH